MAQQTAVEWFHDKVDDLISEELRKRVELLKHEAIQMENAQRFIAQMDMFFEFNNGFVGNTYINRKNAALKYAEQYHNKIFRK